MVLALDQVSDPRNLGAIRAPPRPWAWRAVLLPRAAQRRAGRGLRKAASGALDLLPILEVVNLAARWPSCSSAATGSSASSGGRREPERPSTCSPRIVLVLGSEGEGLRRLVADHCDLLARLEIDPRMESLNVSVAAGIALYLLARKAWFRALVSAFGSPGKGMPRSTSATTQAS